MSYKAIFEIGPIFDYLKSTRKTKDLWGGSFLFSYLMGVVAKSILESEIENFNLDRDIEKVSSVIKRPNLTEDFLFQHICNPSKDIKTSAGSIPDQIYCQISNEKTPSVVLKKFQAELLTRFNTSIIKLLENYKTEFTKSSEIINDQLRKYFRLFFVQSPENSNDHEKLNKAIAARGSIFEFDSFKDEMNSPNSKDEKCSLCGDRRKVITLKNARRNNKDEHLCAICTIKRGLLDVFRKHIGIAHFLSTSSVAALVPKKVIKEKYKIIKNDLEIFIDAHKESEDALEDLEREEFKELEKRKIDEKIADHLSYLFYFSDHPEARRFKRIVKDHANEQDKPWVDRAFFAIIALDGDDTGKILNLCEEKGYTDELSKAINRYTRETSDIIKVGNGQLIFCGGEDTLAIIHPRKVLTIVQELNNTFKTSFIETAKLINKDFSKFSISAGCVICHHKHPLNIAIEEAHEMLDFVAKKEPGKESIAVRLIKGGSDRCDFICKINDESIYSLKYFQELIGCGIPRGFVFNLIDEKDILQQTLKNKDEIAKYLFFLFNKTRTNLSKEEKEKIRNVLEKLTNIYDESGDPKDGIEKIINYLYFARFLEGGE